MNCTVPVGELPLTVAVKVTVWPRGDGFADKTSLTVVVPGPPAAAQVPEGPLKVLLLLSDPGLEVQVSAVPLVMPTVLQSQRRSIQSSHSLLWKRTFADRC